MLFTETPTDTGEGLNQAELAALASAAQVGWLTLTSEVGDQALAHWQSECERCGKAFAVVRLESQRHRASLWFLPTTEREWTPAEQRRIMDALAKTTGYVVSGNHACGFTRLGDEVEVMQQLLAADTGVH
jgi:hypothetical protein